MKRWLKRVFGDRGERLAVRHLKQQGYKILRRQYRNLMGEIDIIARDGEAVVFIEVKTRKSTAAGDPVEAITFDKQKKLTQLALAFLKRYNLLEHRARFDVIAIVWPDDGEDPELTHYQNAFEAVGSGQMFS